MGNSNILKAAGSDTMWGQPPSAVLRVEGPMRFHLKGRRPDE